MKNNFVSVILPVYNASQFLEKAIDSILSQTYLNFELIIINDGSTDNSENLILNYGDPRIKYHFQDNAGVASTLNKGISLACGDYIWRHDADDISLPNKLEKQVNFLIENPEYSLCATQVAFMTENGKVAKDFKMPGDSYFLNERYVKVERSHFNPYCPITHGTVLVKTELLKEIGGYRKEFITSEDIDAWLRFLEIGSAAVIHEVLSFHRLSSNSATQIHGWKNQYYREKALEFFDKRSLGEKDDLELGRTLQVPESNPFYLKIKIKSGKNFRNDLIHFLVPLYKNANDKRLYWSSIVLFIKEGFRIGNTYKQLLIHFLGNKVVKRIVKIKALVS